MIVVSPNELSCYASGDDITGYINPPSWNGYQEGSVIKQCEGCPFYVISEGQPHRLDMSGDEFISFGYSWNTVATVSFPITSGDPFPAWRFKVEANICKTRIDTAWPQLGGSSLLAAMSGYIGPQAIPAIGVDGWFASTPDGILADKAGRILVLSYYSGESLQAFDKNGVKLWGIRGTGEAALGDNTIYAIGCENDVYKTLLHIDPATGAIRSSFRLVYDGSIGNCGHLNCGFDF